MNRLRLSSTSTHVDELNVISLFPKGPCTHIVHIWALKLLYRNPFKAQVYAIWVHGPFGVARVAPVGAGRCEALGRLDENVRGLQPDALVQVPPAHPRLGDLGVLGFRV